MRKVGARCRKRPSCDAQRQAHQDLRETQNGQCMRHLSQRGGWHATYSINSGLPGRTRQAVRSGALVELRYRATCTAYVDSRDGRGCAPSRRLKDPATRAERTELQRQMGFQSLAGVKGLPGSPRDSVSAGGSRRVWDCLLLRSLLLAQAACVASGTGLLRPGRSRSNASVRPEATLCQCHRSWTSAVAHRRCAIAAVQLHGTAMQITSCASLGAAPQDRRWLTPC